MENALRACCKGIKIGKILIHRDGDNGKQVLVLLFVKSFVLELSCAYSILLRHPYSLFFTTSFLPI